MTVDEAVIKLMALQDEGLGGVELVVEDRDGDFIDDIYDNGGIVVIGQCDRDHGEVRRRILT
jgi:hypothetical protein